MDKMITGKNIVKTFGRGKKNALDGVNIEIGKGEFTVIMGPSGCGKSTLLFTLSGTDSIDSGSVKFDETELSELSENKLSDIRRAKMDFVFQQPAKLEKRDITEVSGGQLQRAGICCALMNTPDILFADKPTGALNSKASEEIMDLFSDINKNGTAILLVIHDAKVADRAERILFIKDAKIASQMQFTTFSKNFRTDRIEKITEKMGEIKI